MIWLIFLLFVCGLLFGFYSWKQKQLMRRKTAENDMKNLEERMRVQQQLRDQLQTKVLVAKQFQQSYASRTTTLEQKRFELTNELFSKFADYSEQ
jgi:hypothetical protein